MVKCVDALEITHESDVLEIGTSMLYVPCCVFFADRRRFLDASGCEGCFARMCGCAYRLWMRILGQPDPSVQASQRDDYNTGNDDNEHKMQM